MTSSTETPLLEDSMSGTVDHRGLPVRRSCSGGWKSAGFIIGVEVAERFVYFGIGSNLISYLTGPIGQSTAAAAANVNAWTGTASLLPILGAFFADAFLGRYRTILVASLIYLLGLGSLTLSAFLIPSNTSTSKAASSLSPLLEALFFFSLYLVAVGQGGHKPCVQAFAADQFDGNDPAESKARSSFFNWWYLSYSMGINLSLLVVVYVQDNLSWALGFGIPCIFMLISLVLFLLGTKTYRYAIKPKGINNPFARIANVFLTAFKNRRCAADQTRSKPLSFLDKALLSQDCPASAEGKNPCSIKEVEEAKALLRLIPIWITTFGYAIPYAQSTTFFTKQGATMDRKIFPGVEIPAASLQLFTGISIVIFVPIYDRVFVPIARSVTGKQSGITMLQRIGAGMVLSSSTMVLAAWVETKRLKTAQEHGPNLNVPMSIWWLVPQYVLFGLGDVLTIVGMQEFFYDQVPTELRTIGISFFLGALGVGSFLSSFLVSVIDGATGRDGGARWFSTDLNRAHLDYFYWLLAGLSALGFAAFSYLSKSYIYNK